LAANSEYANNCDFQETKVLSIQPELRKPPKGCLGAINGEECQGQFNINLEMVKAL